MVWRVGAVTSLASLLSALDITVVNVALESIGQELHAPLPDVAWVVTGYLLAMAVVLPTAGWASRRFGMRRTYLASLVAFTVASLLCALAPTLGALVAARVLQGVAGALLTPLGQMITVSVTPRASLGHVMGVLAIPVLVAPILGPIVGGILIDAYGWPSVFLLNLPLCALALVAAWRELPHDVPARGAGLDVLGLALAGPGLALLTYGLSETAHRDSLGDAHVVLPVVAGIALLTAFVRHDLTRESPLLDLRLLAFPTYRAAAATSLATSVITLGTIVLLPLYLQQARGLSPTRTALLTMPTAVGVMLMLRTAGRAADKHGGGPVATLGALLLAVATVPLMTLDGDTSYVLLSSSQLVRGIGVAMLTGPVTAAAMRALPPRAVPDASVQLNVVQRVGGSLGTALFVVLLQRRITALPAADAASAWGWTHLWVLVACAALAVPAVALARAERRTQEPVPA